MKLLIQLSCFSVMLVMLASCGNVKNLQYMQGGFDTAKLGHYKVPIPVIQKGDLISIVVYSDNPAATAIYNQPVTASNSAALQQTVGAPTGTTTAPVGGYLVDDEGDIQFQGIGKLHVQGLTKSGLIDLLNTKLSPFLTNQYYTIRFLNFKITVIGDVAKPAVYSIPSERINILEAIGLAGDLNVSARRDNIRVVREQDGKRSFGIIDLRQPDIFNNPYYYLQQNDIIYVDLSNAKAVTNDAVVVRNIGLATSILSTIAIIVTVLKK